MELEYRADHEAITREERELAFYDCDYQKRMKISAILKMTAQLAAEDYLRKGMGHDFLWDHGFVFLLSRISLRIIKYPREPQLLENTTWEAGKQGAMFLRRYEMAVDGQVHVEGESGWIVVNPLTRKIHRPAQFPWPMSQLTGHESQAKPIGKIDHTGAEKAGEYKIGVSVLDANGHVYNGNYADIAADVFSYQEYQRDVENYRINFVNEAKWGETIALFRRDSREDGRDVSAVTGRVGDKVCFECEYTWKEPDQRG